jgi:hypothetical protein
MNSGRSRYHPRGIEFVGVASLQSLKLEDAIQAVLPI